MLSACMIVTNEEECLARAIDSIVSAVDEIIVVDGGSEDRTRSIAMGYQKVKLFDIPMPDDFAVQRNNSIELASGEWIIVLDGDEYFEPLAVSCFPRLMASEKYDAFAFSRKNIVDGFLTNLHSHDFQVRLFRSYCRYVSNELGIHEGARGYNKLQLINLDIKHDKKSEWQHVDNIRCWDRGQPPPPGWAKVDGDWTYVGLEDAE